VIVRRASAADVPDVTALEERLFGLDAWSAPSVAEELCGERRLALVAVDDAEEAMAGYAVTLLVGDSVDLQRIAVAPAYQRRGVARALLATAMEEARGAGDEQMLAEVSDRNEGALAFYASEGFVEIDRRRGYYRDGSDALVLRLALRGEPSGEGHQPEAGGQVEGH
jgi:[ribosomal protein S18]-alanine N-acetyltransferase